MYIINCITYTYCKKLYIGETRRRQGDRFQEHLRDVERNDTDASKPVARYSNLPNHSKHHIAVFGVSPTSRQFGKPKNSRINIYLPNRHPLIHTVSTSAFHLTNLFLFLVTMFPPITQRHFLHINPHTTYNSSNWSAEGRTLEMSAFKLFTVANLFSTQLLTLNYPSILSH